MPLSINVGLSRKASRDYQSTGVSINVTAELDQALLARPQEFQQQIGDLYAQAEAALERQAGTMAQSDTPRQTTRATGNGTTSRGYGNGNGNGNGSGNGRRSNGNGGNNGNNGNSGGTATASQLRAIAAIARRVDVDPAAEAQAVIGVDSLDALTLRQASELIDHLKSLEPAGNGRNGR